MKKSRLLSLLFSFLLLNSCNTKNKETKQIENLTSFPEKIALNVGDFSAEYSDASIEFLKEKIGLTRYPDEILNSNGKYGFDETYLKQIMDYWANDFSFEKHLKRLNRWNQKIVEIDGLKLHYVLERTERANAIPIVLLHGWPSTYLQMDKIIPLLKEKGFDVIVISLPGYGFSQITSEEGMAVHKMAELMQTLVVDNLGYEKFIIRASDIGAGVAKEWALAYPDNVMGLHLSGSSPYIYQVPSDLIKAESEFVQNAQAFMQRNGAYAALHSTEPQSLAYALNDSPSGLAAWILKRYATWSDNENNLESVYSKDDLLDIVTVYWMTETINASMRSYFESANVYSPNFGKPVTVPTAFLMLKKDIATAPREWEARTFTNIVQWNENETGGHFAEWEKPEVVASDIQQFSNTLENVQ